MIVDRDQYQKQFSEDDAVGWMAIDAALEKIYSNIVPRHYGPPIHQRIGGDNPLDGISIYDSHKQAMHRHIVSYGMSSLYYDIESADTEVSGWGFEFTMRTLPFSEDHDAVGSDGKLVKHEPFWVSGLMNNLARYVFDTHNWFEFYHFIPANGPVRLETKTQITALAFVPDVELGTINTPHGTLDFLQMVGLTEVEYQWLLVENTQTRTKKLIDMMRKDNPMLINDLTRTKSYV
jgi:hypothetical protein